MGFQKSAGETGVRRGHGLERAHTSRTVRGSSEHDASSKSDWQRPRSDVSISTTMRISIRVRVVGGQALPRDRQLVVAETVVKAKQRLKAVRHSSVALSETWPCASGFFRTAPNARSRLSFWNTGADGARFAQERPRSRRGDHHHARRHRHRHRIARDRARPGLGCARDPQRTARVCGDKARPRGRCEV